MQSTGALHPVKHICAVIEVYFVMMLISLQRSFRLAHNMSAIMTLQCIPTTRSVKQSSNFRNSVLNLEFKFYLNTFNIQISDWNLSTIFT